MKQSIGILEVEGFLAATATVDDMIKHAYVELVKIEKTGAGLVTIIIQGDLASVQAALEAGMIIAGKLGDVVGVKAIPKPDPALYEKLLHRTDRAGEQ